MITGWAWFAFTLLGIHYLGWGFFVLLPIIAVILCVVVQCCEDHHLMKFDLNPFSSWPRKDQP